MKLRKSGESIQLNLGNIPSLDNLKIGASLEPHQLNETNFLYFHLYKRCFPFGIHNRHNKINLPVGCWVWRVYPDRNDKFVDRSLCRIEEIDPSNPNIFSAYNKSARNLADQPVSDAYASMLQSATDIGPLYGYKCGEDYYIVDGHRRLAGARKIKKKLKILVDYVEKCKTLTLTNFLQDQQVGMSSFMSCVYNSDQIVSEPESRYEYDYQTKRQQYYPSVGEQLAAVMEVLKNESPRLRSLYDEIEMVKQRFPK